MDVLINWLGRFQVCIQGIIKVHKCIFLQKIGLLLLQQKTLFINYNALKQRVNNFFLPNLLFVVKKFSLLAKRKFETKSRFVPRAKMQNKEFHFLSQTKKREEPFETNRCPLTLRSPLSNFWSGKNTFSVSTVFLNQGTFKWWFSLMHSL